MTQSRRYGLSAAEKADIWRRWKVGESLHEIGRAFGKDHGSIQFLCRSTVGSLRQSAAVHSERSRWPSGKIFPEVLPPVLRFGRLRGVCNERRRR